MNEQEQKQIERIRREYNANCQADSDIRFLLRMLDDSQEASKLSAQDAEHWRLRCEAWVLRARSLEMECSVIADFARETIRLVPMRKSKRKVYEWCAVCIGNAIANVNEKWPEPQWPIA